MNVDHGYKFKQGKVCINGVEGFWSFAKERLIKHHGISKNKFLLYIKEMEWRYNHRTDNLFELLVKYMLWQIIDNHQKLISTDLSDDIHMSSVKPTTPL